MPLKAVIPAAGFGTRMLPAAKAVPKELLPVLSKPTIQYVVEESAGAGADEVVLITSRLKPALLGHFAAAPELEERLARTGKLGFIESVLELRNKIGIHAVYQEEQLGLGHAVLQARARVGANRFLCLLGDTIFSGASPAAQLVAAAEKLGPQASVIGLERVPKEKVSRYGIVGGVEVRPDVARGLLRIDRLVEKPKPDAAPSDLAIAARYLLSPAIFDHLTHVTPDKGGEIGLTPALNALAADGEVYGLILQGRRHDIGSPEDWLATNIHFARSDPTMWNVVRAALEK